MCGIFGIIYFDGETEPCEKRLRRSAELIHHRGPDGCGVYAEPGIGFAHTRLSLVDLQDRSDQPLWDSQGRYCLVYNGEIYNFQELRKDLQEQGVVFRTTSDTEVLLYCLIYDGTERTLARIQGMFAFAFYDRVDRALILARDRFGIKPLLVYQDGQQLLFGSEVKAMQPWIDLRPDGFHVIRYLMNFGAPVRNWGFFDNIEIVPPGSVIKWQLGSLPKKEQFIDLPSMIDRGKVEELEHLSSEQVVDRVDELLQRSVEDMLFADAAVGALCSGGVDSSLLMAMAAKKHNNLAIFHADVVGPLSEFGAAETLAKHLKLELLTVQIRDQDFINMTPEVLYHYEQPFFGHPHSVPFYLVSKLVQHHGVKGVLTGEGADECFLGYSYVAHEPLWEQFHRSLGRVREILGKLPLIGPHLWDVKGSIPELVPEMLGQFEVVMDKQYSRQMYSQRLGRGIERNVRTLDLLGNHLRTLLHRNDTMGMGASIEARFPFLDERLIATAINLPYRNKIRFSPLVWEKDHPFLRDKWVLRQVADRYLPKILSQRKKLGFEVSAFGRMRLHKTFFKRAFVTNFFKLPKKESDFLFENADQRLSIKLMMLEVWGRIFFQGETASGVQKSLQEHASYPQ